MAPARPEGREAEDDREGEGRGTDFHESAGRPRFTDDREAGLAPPLAFRSLAVRRLLSRHGQLWADHVSTENTSIQFGLLLCLARAESGLSQTEIAAQLAIDKATLTELMRRMASHGHVTVQRDARDGRRRVATLTPAGRQRLIELYRPALEINERLFAPLSAEEAEQLTGMLQRILDHDPAADDAPSGLGGPDAG